VGVFFLNTVYLSILLSHYATVQGMRYHSAVEELQVNQVINGVNLRKLLRDNCRLEAGM